MCNNNNVSGVTKSPPGGCRETVNLTPKPYFNTCTRPACMRVADTIERTKDTSSVEMSLGAIYRLALCGQHGLVDSHFTLHTST